MRILITAGICLALAACAGQPVRKASQCSGPERPANPHGVTLPSLASLSVPDVFDRGATAPRESGPAGTEVPSLEPSPCTASDKEC